MNLDNKHNNKIKFISFFLGFTTIEKIDSFYNKKLQKWLLRNSHVVKHSELDKNNNFIPNYDERGNFINAEFSKKTKDNIPLTEEDFIASELMLISFFDLNILDLSKKKRIEYYVAHLKNISDKKETARFEKTSTAKNNESKLWFKVGLLFANGSMDKYYNTNKTGIKTQYTAPKIAKELGNASYNKFILATMNNYPIDNPNANKNIFNSSDKMQKIINHCNELQIKVIEDFTKRLPIE